MSDVALRQGAGFDLAGPGAIVSTCSYCIIFEGVYWEGNWHCLRWLDVVLLRLFAMVSCLLLRGSWCLSAYRGVPGFFISCLERAVVGWLQSFMHVYWCSCCARLRGARLGFVRVDRSVLPLSSKR